MTMIAISTDRHPVRIVPFLFAVLSTAIAARKQRKVLKSLETAQLNDLGITYKQALREARKPIWDVPKHWKR